MNTSHVRTFAALQLVRVFKGLSTNSDPQQMLVLPQHEALPWMLDSCLKEYALLLFHSSAGLSVEMDG